MPTPKQILEQAMEQARLSVNPLIHEESIYTRLEFVCEGSLNRSGVRVLLACTLAKIHRPDIDIRKPYKAIRRKNSDILIIDPPLTRPHVGGS